MEGYHVILYIPWAATSFLLHISNVFIFIVNPLSITVTIRYVVSMFILI